jgi:hypothetical protein
VSGFDVNQSRRKDIIGTFSSKIAKKLDQAKIGRGRQGDKK